MNDMRIVEQRSDDAIWPSKQKLHKLIRNAVCRAGKAYNGILDSG